MDTKTMKKETNPDIYCCNLKVTVIFPTKSKYQTPERRTIVLDKIPVLLLNNELPPKEKDILFKKVFDEHIHKGDFTKYKFRIENIEIITFLSKICYTYSF